MCQHDVYHLYHLHSPFTRPVIGNEITVISVYTFFLNGGYLKFVPKVIIAALTS